MVSIEFNFNQKITIIKADLSDPFQISINEFYKKSSIQPKSVYFTVGTIQIKPEETIESYMNHFNIHDNILKVFVYSINEDNKNQEIVQSKEIICPECKEPCRIKIDEYHIKLFGCPTGHITSGIKLDDFQKTQEINISSIICGHCKIRNYSTNDDFFYCLTCKLNLCILCKSNHDSNHNIIKYYQKNYRCSKHNDNYIKYCKNCSINICSTCEIEHNEHKTISLLDSELDIEKTKERLIEIKKEVEEFKKQIKEIIAQLNGLMKSVNVFYIKILKIPKEKMKLMKLIIH